LLTLVYATSLGKSISKPFINLTPLKHPEKSSIFLGTPLIPLSLIRRGGRDFREGLTPLSDTPNKGGEASEGGRVGKKSISLTRGYLSHIISPRQSPQRCIRG
jgi:hypothetical protein